MFELPIGETLERAPTTDDPQPRSRALELELAGGPVVRAKDDPYSDRIRCDHPRSIVDASEAEALGEALLEAAAEQGRGRVVVLANPVVEQGLRSVGYRREGLMPNFYRGQEDCAVMGAYPDSERAELANPEPVAEVFSLLERKRGPGRKHEPVPTRLAEVGDAPKLAALLAKTFEQYPTPSGDPEYLAEAIDEGIPFRIAEHEGEPIACASADLLRTARTAELTDCATRPEHRGRGLMQFILEDLMDDLRGMGYPTAFTLARAAIPGVNLAFARLGFELRGTMPQSCRIGEGIEDMNIWSRAV